jgi:2-methylisocitrate lyase-like PEP mutase family enzyme
MPTSSTARRAAFRAKVEERNGLLVPGAFNAMSARVIEDAGFEALYLTGAGVTNMSRLTCAIRCARSSAAAPTRSSSKTR